MTILKKVGNHTIDIKEGTQSTVYPAVIIAGLVIVALGTAIYYVFSPDYVGIITSLIIEGVVAFGLICIVKLEEPCYELSTDGYTNTIRIRKTTLERDEIEILRVVDIIEKGLKERVLKEKVSEKDISKIIKKVQGNNAMNE